jgi:hypothetical protein
MAHWCGDDHEAALDTVLGAVLALAAVHRG